VHILGIGQSNLANHCGTPRTSPFGRVVLRGVDLPLSDPVAGGSGSAGSVWPRLADRLSQVPEVSDLALTLTAVGGTSIAEWAPGGPLFKTLVERSDHGDLGAVTHVVFQQGEKDTKLRTSTDGYLAAFMALYDGVSTLVGPATWIICRSSYRLGETSAHVIQAQNQAVASIAEAAAGPDLDRLGPKFRYDDAHFNDAGLERFAAELAEALVAVRTTRGQGIENS
jgi:hypothetical protein